MSFSDFFQGTPVQPPQHNPEPPGFELIRDLLMRKAFGLQSDPYGYMAQQPAGFSTGLINAPAFGGGNTPGYPTATTSGGGGGWGQGGRQPRVVTRPVGHMDGALVPGARVPISVRSGAAGRNTGNTGSQAPHDAALQRMLGSTPRSSYDGCGQTHYDGVPGDPGYTPPAANPTHAPWAPGAPTHPLQSVLDAMQNHMPVGATHAYNDFEGQHRWADPRMAGRMGQFGSQHTFGGYGSNGEISPFMAQNGLQGQAGQRWGRPNDSVAAGVYDNLMRRNGGHGPSGFGGYSMSPAAAPPPATPPPARDPRHINRQSHATIPQNRIPSDPYHQNPLS